MGSRQGLKPKRISPRPVSNNSPTSSTTSLSTLNLQLPVLMIIRPLYHGSLLVGLSSTQEPSSGINEMYTSKIQRAIDNLDWPKLREAEAGAGAVISLQPSVVARIDYLKQLILCCSSLLFRIDLGQHSDH